MQSPQITGIWIMARPSEFGPLETVVVSGGTKGILNWVQRFAVQPVGLRFQREAGFVVPVVRPSVIARMPRPGRVRQVLCR